jgi:hypothetical protein
MYLWQYLNTARSDVDILCGHNGSTVSNSGSSLDAHTGHWLVIMAGCHWIAPGCFPSGDDGLFVRSESHVR